MTKGLLGQSLVSLLCLSGMLFVMITLATMVYAPKASALLKDVLAPVLSSSDEKEETTGHEPSQERSTSSGDRSLLPLPEVKLVLPEIKVDTPIIKAETPPISVETGRDIRDTRIDVPSVKVDTPIAKVDTPKVEANTTTVVPEVRVTVPEAEIKTPVIRTVTPEVKVEVKPDPVLPDIGISLPPTEVKTPIVNVETPRIEVQLPAPGKQLPDKGTGVEVEAGPVKPLPQVEAAVPPAPTIVPEAVTPTAPNGDLEIPALQEADLNQAQPVEPPLIVVMHDHPAAGSIGEEEAMSQLEPEGHAVLVGVVDSTVMDFQGVNADASKLDVISSHRDQEQSPPASGRSQSATAQSLPALPPVWSSAGPGGPAGSGASGQSGAPGTGGASATPIHLNDGAVPVLPTASGSRLSTLYLLGKDQWCQPPPGQPPMYAFFSDVCDTITHI